MSKTITRVYEDYAMAEETVRELRGAGLGASNIGLVASNADGWHRPGASSVSPIHDKDRDGKDDRAEGAATGGGLGAILGGAAGAAAGLGMIAIPGIGPVVAAGWLAALAAGAVGGGVAGGLIGALVESGTARRMPSFMPRPSAAAAPSSPPRSPMMTKRNTPPSWITAAMTSARVARSGPMKGGRAMTRTRRSLPPSKCAASGRSITGRNGLPI